MNELARRTTVGVVLLLTLPLAACGAAPDEGLESEDEVEIRQEPAAADPPVTITPFNTSSSMPLVGHTNVCVLGQVTGDFGSAGESTVNLDVGGWRARGRGTAICAPTTNFANGPGDWQKLKSSTHSAMMWSDQGIWDPGGCSRAQGFPETVACASLWQGDAFSWISAVYGELQGGGEWVRIDQSVTGSGFNRLAVLEHTDFLLTGNSHSFFVGVPGAFRRVRLAGYNAQGQEITGFMGDGNTYTMNVTSRVGQGPQQFWLAKTSVALCALTRVSGNFDGGGESLVIRKQLNANGHQYWVLHAIAGGGTVYGAARCMAYDQR